MIVAGGRARRVGRWLGRILAALAVAASLTLAPRLPVPGPLDSPGGPPAIVLAADPSATPETAGDPRSVGQGPGLVGRPFLAIGVVLIVGIVSVGLTLLYVRLTADRRS